MISSLWSYIYILNHNYEHTGIVEDKKLLRTAGFGAKSPGNKSSLGISVEGSDFVAQSDGLKAILEPWLTLLWPVSTADSPRKVELSELELSINESNGSSFSRTLPLTVPPLIVPKQGSICWTWGKDWWTDGWKPGKNKIQEDGMFAVILKNLQAGPISWTSSPLVHFSDNFDTEWSRSLLGNRCGA